MGAELLPLDKVPGWIMRTTERKMPTVAKAVKTEVLYAAWHDPLVTEQRVLTGTLRASTVPYAGEFQGRGLEYGDDHEPLPESEIDQVIAGSEPGDTVGIAEDATKNGRPYGIYVETQFGLFAQTAERLRSRLALLIARAIAKTIFGRGR